MKQYLLSALFTAIIISKCLAIDFYVSPTATGSGGGSFASPWKLQQALNSPAAITSQTDTIWVWLRAGIYTNTFDAQTSFSCHTNGSANAPIIFRNYQNERASIDGQLSYTLLCGLGNCSFTWFSGIEVFNSDNSDRDHSNIDRLGNIYCTAKNMKFINMIVHDMGSGLDSWKTATNSETYGCIIYNIGNNLLNGLNWEGHGHGMYLQNDTLGIKNIQDNIIFSTYGYGMKVWQTTNTDALGNFDIQRNIIFNGGAASENLGGAGNNSRTHNFFVVSNGINNPIRNTVIKHNYTYAGTNTPRPPVNAFGLNYGVDNMTLNSNYLTCQTRLGFNNTPLFNASVSGNKIIAGIPAAYGYFLWGFTNSDFPQNTYLDEQPSSGLEYFVLPNKYEQGRAHIAIYNWDAAESVQIDASNSGLKAGDIYELVNVMDYYDDIITDTLDAGGIISISMTGHTFAAVIGSTKAPVSQFPTFGAFLIRKVGGSIISSSSQIAINHSLAIFPNPARAILNVSFTINHPGYCKLTVTDILGNTKLLHNAIYCMQGKQEIQIDMNQFANGIYLLQLRNDRESMTRTIILSK
ncbi:MAG: T9SS type A sorting domain-containing protein [Saprospiraceae bacterium]